MSLITMDRRVTENTHCYPHGCKSAGTLNILTNMHNAKGSSALLRKFTKNSINRSVNQGLARGVQMHGGIAKKGGEGIAGGGGYSNECNSSRPRRMYGC